MYQTIRSTDLRPQLSLCLTRVMGGGPRLLIMRNGKDTAALVRVQDLMALERVELEREELMEARHQKMMEEFRKLKEGLR